MSRQQPQPRFGPQFIVPITYSDVAGRKASQPLSASKADLVPLESLLEVVPDKRG
jgi:hypothetical protein